MKDHEVEYLVIGGIAAVIYGVPRATFDLDLLIRPTVSNVDKLLAALTAAGLGTASLITAEELLANEITVFNDRIRVDVQTFTPGLNFNEGWDNRTIMDYLGTTLYLASKNHLIASKRAAGRAIDLSDVELLESSDN